jgi:hypothetical protein
MNFKFIQEARRTCVISYRVDFFDRGRPGADMGLGRGLKHLLIDFLAQLLDIGPNCTGPSTESTRPADAVRQDRKRSRGHGPRISASGSGDSKAGQWPGVAAPTSVFAESQEAASTHLTDC